MHLERGGLVDGDDHGLAHEAAAEEVAHDVLRHRLQPVVAGDQVILAAQHLLQLRLLLVVETRLLDQPVEVVVEVGIDKLQFGCAVRVEERHRGAVLHRLLEVVDRDVVAEDRARALLAGDERRAGEGEEDRPRQRAAHVERQRVVLAAVRFVGEHHDIGPVGEQLRRLELVDQREDGAMVAGQQLAQVRAALGVAAVALGRRDRAHGLEGLGDLVVQLDAVGDHHEGPVARHFAQHLLGKEDHGEALAAALRLPEDAAAPVAQPARCEHARRWHC